MMLLQCELSILFLLCCTMAGTVAGHSDVVQNCLNTNNSNGLPMFQGYTGEPGRRIHHQHQAIITSYKFNCCGNITEWGVDVNPLSYGSYIITFDFDFQVWRPSPTVNETGCYSLVDNFMATSISIPSSPASEHVARVAPSPPYQLLFHPGDVLGFYVESHGEGSWTGGDDNNGVVVLNDSSHTSELVWHGRITSLTSQSHSCPYPVGTSGVLNLSTHAAPVISINITTNSESCPYSQIQSSSDYNLPSPIPSPGRHSLNNIHGGLIAGITVTIIVVCVSTLVIISAVVVWKRYTKQTKERSSTDTSMALTNQVYGMSEMAHIGATYECPVSSIDCKSTGEMTGKEPAHYHSGGPDASKPRSSHIYVGDPLRSDMHQHDTASWEKMDSECCVYENTCTDAEDATVYETPMDDVFDTSGLYVPTAEERLGSDYGKQTFSTDVYSKLKFFVEDQIYWAPPSSTSDLYSQLALKKYREIPTKQIKILKALGSGEFGNVYKAVWSISGSTKEVAVKTLKPGSSENDRVRFLQEAAIMGQFNHQHVMRLYGVVTVGDPIMICIELMAKGDLRGFLETVNSYKQLELQLLRFSRQIALGMAYLSKKAFIHRDLAARNILLDEALTCKISDFGMARDLDDDTYYTVQSKGGKIPVKWTAPEALFYKKYSTDSDVWSYGMVLFEIWSVGKKPFSQITNKEVLKKINSGYCQPPPPGIPRSIYQLMVDCWNPTHSQRPPFSKISATLNASSSTLLQWTGDDRSVAGQLGGQLSEAQFLYQDLQNTYIKTSS